MKESVKNMIRGWTRLLKAVYWKFIDLAYRLNVLSINKIPIIINNFNRLSYPKQLLQFLEQCGFTNIIILDNNSTYTPLLQFYGNTTARIIRLPQNYGHLALWKSGYYNKVKWNYFAYTDSDVVPIEQCPSDFLSRFKQLLSHHHRLDKIGFGIRIDDLPESFAYRNKVIAYEKKYWQKEAGPNIYDAPIDTTFALYKPFTGLVGGEAFLVSAYRLGFPYLLKHLPWYVDSANLSEEEQYYLKTCNTSSSIGKQVDENHAVY